MNERFIMVATQAGHELEPSLVAQVVDAAIQVKTPLGLAGLIMLVFYGVMKLVVEKVPQITQRIGGELLEGIVNWVGVLALVAIVLAMILRTDVLEQLADHEDPIVNELRLKNEAIQRIRADYETWVSKQRPDDQRHQLSAKASRAADGLEELARLHREAIGDVLHCMTSINAASGYSYAAAAAPSATKRRDAARRATDLAWSAVEQMHLLIEAARESPGSDLAREVQRLEDEDNMARALSALAVGMAIEIESGGQTRPADLMKVLVDFAAHSSEGVLAESISNNRDICTFLVAYEQDIENDEIVAWRDECRPLVTAPITS